MEERRANRRLIAIAILGVVGCAVAFGVRAFHRKPIHGTWLGYNYIDFNGKMVANLEFGQYALELTEHGTYHENGNQTSGTWSQKGDTITLKPTKFLDMTPDQHREKYMKRDGRVSDTIKRLLDTRMKPMTISYSSSSDRLIYDEPQMHYEFERSR